MGTAFPKRVLVNTLGEWVAKQGLTQFRLAETEKYPHVTFFLNGGREEPFAGEDRDMPKSPKVATYDLQPEMSAGEVADHLVAAIEKGYDLIVVNFANPDMVGHTGVYEAIIKAVQTVDTCLQRLVEVGEELGYEFLIIADHGNADFAVNDDGSPNTAHTTNPVPVWWVTQEREQDLRHGILADVAPTLLSYNTPNVFTIDTAITNLQPTVSGENLTFSISPSLPNGLSFDTTTGIISGTPTVLQSATDYEVTVTNSGGSTSFTLSIAVIDVAPTLLSYTTPNIFTIDEAITDLQPTVSGENLVFSISPSLPTGLSFDTATGIISGTPTVLQSATDYEVTATNSGGSVSFIVSIAVEEELGLIDEVKKLFTVYPNPFENEINVIHEFDDVSYSIFSLDGKEIQKGRLLNSKISINQLPSSVYLLKLQSEEKVQIIKMVKQ